MKNENLVVLNGKERNH